MEFLLIVFLTLLNGVFAMSELALAASRKARLNAMADAGDNGAQAALTLLGNPNKFLSTVQVGITSIGVLNGIVGEAAFSAGVAVWLHGFGVAEKAAAISATAIVVTLITFTTIIFGELVPKRIGQLHPESVARWVSRPMLWLATAAGPFVKLLSSTTAAVLRLLRIDINASRAVTEEEITASLEEGVDAGVIEQHEHQMVQNVFQLDERPLTSLMVPRTDVEWLDATNTVAQSLTIAGKESRKGAHSWYPVCRGSLDDVVGLISIARLLELGADTPGAIEAYVTPASFVPETLSGMELLEQFRAKAGRFVLVVDEYGVVQGLLTPRDLLEAITGELQSGAEIDAWATQRDDGSWLLDGVMPVGELKVRLGLDDLPGEDRGRYNTVAGLLMSVSGHLPAVGERIECADWRFEVIDLDGKRIDKVLATQLAE
ncbi:MAG: hemolysin family protein [Rhodoferax sp.]|nr:hemolysin family protein [Rhodoferax sp.]